MKFTGKLTPLHMWLKFAYDFRRYYAIFRLDGVRVIQPSDWCVTLPLSFGNDVLNRNITFEYFSCRKFHIGVEINVLVNRMIYNKLSTCAMIFMYYWGKMLVTYFLLRNLVV